MAAKADAAIVAVGYRPDSETEGWDWTFQLPVGQIELIKRIAAKNKNTIVVPPSLWGKPPALLHACTGTAMAPASLLACLTYLDGLVL